MAKQICYIAYVMYEVFIFPETLRHSFIQHQSLDLAWLSSKHPPLPT